MDSDRWAAMLQVRLEEFGAAEIIEWNHIFDRYAAAGYTADLWGAAWQINGGSSDDGFYYFRCWLIGMGRKIYEKAVADPDSLAEVVHKGTVAEAEIYAAAHLAWIAVTGKTYQDEYPARNEEAALKGTDWKPEDKELVRQKFPRLASIFVG